MIHRNLGPRSLAEAWLPERLGANRRLEAVNKVVDRTSVERSLADVHAARSGRPSYPPLLICQEYSEQLRSPLPPLRGKLPQAEGASPLSLRHQLLRGFPAIHSLTPASTAMELTQVVAGGD